MIFGMLGKKLGMTQVYTESNELIPVTVFQVGPCPVVQVKTRETNGYDAIQIGFGECSDRSISRPLKGHLKKASVSNVAILKEVATERAADFKQGEVLLVDRFKQGQKVDIVGTTKGRGFQGVVRRFNTRGQPASHGSMMHRRIGSIGQCQTPGRVFKNKKMPGHMGDRQRTIQNLEVVSIDVNKNLLLVKGSCPGNNKSFVYIRFAKKAIQAV